MRLIDADKTYEVLAEYYGYTEWWQDNALEEALKKVPTIDAVPVVRCDDCIYRDGKIAGQPNILCWHMHADDFCSYGTRMEEREDDETD